MCASVVTVRRVGGSCGRSAPGSNPGAEKPEPRLHIGVSGHDARRRAIPDPRREPSKATGAARVRNVGMVSAVQMRPQVADQATHPSVAQDATMAAELAEFMRMKLGW